MKSYFKKIYNYNQWANIGLFRHLKTLEHQLPEISKRLSHIVAAEEIWYNRIKPLDFHPLPLFVIQPDEILEPRLNASAQRWLEMVEQTVDFEVQVDYRNLAGHAFKNSLSDIMIHVANHGTHHRGQIATLLRQNGYEPLPTDYIVYSRRGAG
jgi:uncharacterized damage-inducible protein DinB